MATILRHSFLLVAAVALVAGATTPSDASQSDASQSDPVLTADFEHGDNFPPGTITLSGTVSDDAPVLSVRVAIRDRISGAWLQDSMAGWGGFNRFDAVLADPTSPTTSWTLNVELNEGTYAMSVRARAQDGGWGHISPWLRFDVGDDVTPPQIDADFARGAQFTSPVRLSGNATDDQSLVRIRIAIRDRSTGLWLQPDRVTWGDFNRFHTNIFGRAAGDLDWSLTVDLPTGDYALSARATDSQGNETSLKPWRHFSVVP